MRILLLTHVFHPSVGGIETVARLLSEAFVAAGHAVTVVTPTPGPTEGYAYPVVRAPGPRELWRLGRSHDVVLHNNMSLRTAWLPMLMRRPWVVCHHTWVDSSSGRPLVSALKKAVARRARQVSVSRAAARSFGEATAVVPNPYDAKVFHLQPLGERSGLIFVGRLVSDKGCDLALEALAHLHRAGHAECLTIVGQGPEREALQRQAAQLGVDDHVSFAGTQPPEQVAELLNRHRVMLIPSRWAEPFGLVALEGIACGCSVVASDGGGLPDAVGPCGRLFRGGDAVDLSQALLRVLETPHEPERARATAQAHLAAYQPLAVAHAYLELFEAMIRGRSR